MEFNYYLNLVLRYLGLTRVFTFSATLYCKKILYFIVHYIYLTTLVTSYFLYQKHHNAFFLKLKRFKQKGYDHIHLLKKMSVCLPSEFEYSSHISYIIFYQLNL